MKSFIEYSKEVDKSELQRQKDHHEEMAEKHKEKAEHSLMMGDKDGFALHMAKHDHFKAQGDRLKTMKEEVVKEASYINGVKQDPESKVWKLTSLSHADAVAKHGKENVRHVDAVNRSGDKTGRKHVEVLSKLGEETEQIDELSKKTIKSYANKKQAELDDVPPMPFKKPAKSKAETEKAAKGMMGALARLSGRKPTSESVAEEAEQIDELRTSTLLRYQTKANKALIGGDRNKEEKRIKGIQTANYKIQNRYKVKEEIEQFDEASPAWQRKEGKSASGGLNRKGIASYRKANPGSKLSMAVTTKPSKLKPGSKAANRRKSFCARMSGMKKRLTSAKTAKDPNSRINKSLRKWNC